MCELGLIINFETKIVEWDGTKMPMPSKTTQLNRKQLRALLLGTRKEPESTKHKHKRLVGILDAKYKAANLDEPVSSSGSFLVDTPFTWCNFTPLVLSLCSQLGKQHHLLTPLLHFSLTLLPSNWLTFSFLFVICFFFTFDLAFILIFKGNSCGWWVQLTNPNGRVSTMIRLPYPTEYAM